MSGGGAVGVKLQDFQSALRAWGDAWQGQVKRRSDAQEWCKLQGFRETRKFSVNMGPNVAQVLSQAWCERMQHIYDAHKGGLLATVESRAQVMEALVESDEFKALVGSDDREVASHVAAIRALAPPA
eukprot:285158-Lingulodinium_polyedra.AAC.1